MPIHTTPGPHEAGPRRQVGGARTILSKLFDKNHLHHALNFRMSGLLNGAIEKRLFDHRQPASSIVYAPAQTRKLHISYKNLIYRGTREPYWEQSLADLEIVDFFVLELEGAEIIGDGIIVDRHGTILLEASIFRTKYLHQLRQNHIVFFRRLLPAARGGRVISLASALQNNYYHWIMEGIGRLVLLQAQGYLRGDERVLVAGDPPGFVVESIKFLFPELADGILFSPPMRYKPESVVLAAFPYTNTPATRNTDIYLPEAILGINQLAAQRTVQVRQTPVNILISRAKSIQRRLLNEDVLLDELSGLNLQRVFLEEISFTEQVALFQNANIVIAPHGAGLTNLIFSKSNSVIIELFPQNRPMSDILCFGLITSYLGLRHVVFECVASDDTSQDMLLSQSIIDQIKAVAL